MYRYILSVLGIIFFIGIANSCSTSKYLSDEEKKNIKKNDSIINENKKMRILDYNEEIDY